MFKVLISNRHLKLCKVFLNGHLIPNTKSLPKIDGHQNFIYCCQTSSKHHLPNFPKVRRPQNPFICIPMLLLLKILLFNSSHLLSFKAWFNAKLRSVWRLFILIETGMNWHRHRCKKGGTHNAFLKEPFWYEKNDHFLCLIE